LKKFKLKKIKINDWKELIKKYKIMIKKNYLNIEMRPEILTKKTNFNPIFFGTFHSDWFQPDTHFLVALHKYLALRSNAAAIKVYQYLITHLRGNCSESSI
jgi:hypothetical protein